MYHYEPRVFQVHSQIKIDELTASNTKTLWIPYINKGLGSSIIEYDYTIITGSNFHDLYD